MCRTIAVGGGEAWNWTVYGIAVTTFAESVPARTLAASSAASGPARVGDGFPPRPALFVWSLADLRRARFAISEGARTAGGWPGGLVESCRAGRRR
jgi:hypothetical protein